MSRWRFVLALYVSVVGCCVIAGCSAAAEEVSAVLRGRVVLVRDGDSLTLKVGGETVEIRLAQIDAPEWQQRHGREARTALAKLVANRNVIAEVVDTDQYHRKVAEVFVDGIHVNHELVRHGHAWAYTRFARSTRVRDLQDEARRAVRGLWKLPVDQRVAPWEWRSVHDTRSPPKPGDSGPFECGTKRRCGEMTSCAEARFHLTRCGLPLDGDDDGVPCEQVCRR